MSTDKAEAAEKFARTLNRVDAIQGRARSYIEALVREVESLSDALVERDVKLVERDAAVAAIERVRAINTGNNRALYGNDFEAGMAKALWLVKTALDGAPEPEQEYRVEYQVPGGATHVTETVASFEEAYGSMLENIHGGTVMGRSKATPASPWLPVEGEKP